MPSLDSQEDKIILKFLFLALILLYFFLSQNKHFTTEKTEKSVVKYYVHFAKKISQNELTDQKYARK